MKLKRILATFLLIIWLCTVFYFSHQQGTTSGNMSRNVSTIIINIFNLKNEITELEEKEILENIELIIRKIAHYTLYTIGGILIINFMSSYSKNYKFCFIISSILGVSYAITDEIHQLFVSGRNGSIYDVAIDSIGIFTGIAIFLFIEQIIKSIMKKQEFKRRKIN